MEIRERRAMETSPQSFDVCVVCALPEEARAFLEILQQHCEGAFEEHVSSRYHYSSRFATIKNNKGELLNLHISWLPRYGPQEMTLHLSRVLEECQPRVAIMTGICAGDAQQVQLGDLVVAERTFTYDNGKFTLDEQGRSVDLHDTLTYQLDANILQFLGLFDDWKPLVTRLKRPSYPPGQHKRRKIACYIKAMASGSAVRADHPFEVVRAPVRGTVAIDMEGAAFGLVMSRHTQIPWLVVKGVCDYADQNKNNAYHDYAARASALYALSFIRAFVTRERLPRPDRPSPSSRVGPPEVWNVPYYRNPYFTGRDELLDQLDELLAPFEQAATLTSRRVALTQPQAITGLGGIGKTQIAVEYAYRSRDSGRYRHTFWVNAASQETILASFVEIATLLPEFAARNETDQRKLIEAVKHWLEQCKQPWLLIFDNVDHDGDLPAIREYLPQGGSGSVLLTTRASAVGSLATPIEVETMGFVEGALLLLRRAHRVKHTFDLEHMSDEEIDQVHRAGNIVEALDHFPLAIDQAGAYLEETQCSFEEYLDLYQTHRQKLLAERGAQATDYPDSVATTWSLSIQKVQQKRPAAAELLQLCSFLAPDSIPEELITDGAAYWPALLQQAATDPFAFQQMMKELLKYSLVKRLVEDRTLSIHRLVQAMQRDRMDGEVQRQWVERVIRAVNKVFPDLPQDMASWQQCLRYLNQAQVCYELIERYGLTLVEAADVLHRTSLYLGEHALYAEAEPLSQRAIVICERTLGPDHPDVAANLNNLAGLYQSQGKYAEAEPLYQRALAIDEQVLGPDHPDVAANLNNLASLYRGQGKYAEAEPLYQRALTIYEQQLGTEHLDTATALNNLASFYESQGKYAEAEPLYQRALTIYEQQLGTEHPDTARCLNNLAEFYSTQGKYEQAGSLMQQALAIRKRHLEANHPDIAQSLNNLAGIYVFQGKYEQAEPLFQEALSIRKRILGLRHPDTAQTLNNLAEVYRVQNEIELAMPLCQEALVIRKQTLGSDHVDTAQSMHTLAMLYESQGEYERAELLMQQVLKVYQKKLGPDHPDVAVCLNDMSALYYAQGKYEQTELLIHQALAIQEQQLGAEHPNMAAWLKNLADLYRSQGKYTEAEPLYQRALAISKQQLGTEHPQTHQMMSNYLTLLSEIYTGGDLEALLQLLAQGEQDDDKDEGNTEKASS